MSTIRQEARFLVRHSTVYGLGTMLSRTVAFFLLPLYTRYLTPADYGVLELISATASVVGILIALSVTAAMARFYYDLPVPDRPKVVAATYLIAASAAGVAFVPCMLLSRPLAILVLDSADYTRHFQIGFAGLFVGLFLDIGQAYLRLLYRSTLYIVVSIVGMVVAVSLNVFFIVWLHLGVLGILTSGVIAQSALALPLTIGILRTTGVQSNFRMARAMLAFSLPLIPASLMIAVVAYTDRYLLKQFVSVAETGIFGLAMKMSSSVHLLITVPFILTFSQRRYQIGQRPDAPVVLRRIYDFYLIGLLVPATLLALFVEEVMVLMTTPPYYRAGALVPILLLRLVLVGSKYHVEFGIFQSKQTKYDSYANGAAAVSHVILGFLLVRAFGIWGVALAGLLSSSIQVLLLHSVARRLYYVPFDFLRGAKAVGLAAVAVAISRILPTEHWLVLVALKTIVSALFVASLLRLYEIRLGEIVRSGKLLFRPSVATS
jgi:O-antigen/teichoic acid export membrane protein